MLLTDLRGASGSAQAGFDEGKRALETARALVEGPANEALTQTGQAALELRTLITRLDRVVREIERNPQSLVVGRQQPYEEAR